MKIIFYLFVYLFFFFLSWTDLLSIQNKIPLSIIFGIIIIILYFIGYKKIYLSIYELEDFFVLGLVVWVLLSGFIQPNEKSLNYILTYLLILFFLFIVLKSILYTTTPLNILLKANFYGVYFTLFFVIIEFILNTLFDVHIQDYLPKRREATATIGGYIYRSYGFATEPGVVAYYFSTLGLIALWYIFFKSDYSKSIKKALTIIFIIGDLTLYSSTGVFAILFGLFFSTIINIKSIIKNTFRIILIGGILVIFSSYITETMTPLYNKVIYMSQNKSGQMRLERWKESVDTISSNPVLGMGIGYLSANNKGSPISWHLFLMEETGILSGFLIFLYYIFFFFRIKTSKIKGKNLILTSFIAGIIHLSVISTFQYPFLFIAIILITIILKENNYAKI